MRRRLVVVACATTSMVVLAFLLPLGMLLRASAYDQVAADTEVAARGLSPVVATTDRPDELGAAAAAVAASEPSVVRVTVHLPDGTQAGTPAAVDAPVLAAMAGQAMTIRDADRLRTLIPVVRADGSTAVVEAAAQLSLRDTGVVAAWSLLGALGVVLFAVSALVADRLGRSTVAAVRELEQVATRLGDGDLAARTTPTDLPEVAAVGAALRELADRIQRLISSEREAVADLSHRMRTPLMALQLDIEALPASQETARLAADAAQLERAVDLVIRQARRAGGPTAPPEACDLGDAVSRRVTFWRVLAEDQGRALTYEPSRTPVPVALAPDELDAAIDALLGNVFAHTPEGTALTVAVASSNDRCTLVVEDEGPGFGVWQPAERGVSGVGSTGLGLSIVRATAERGGGSLDVGPGTRGGARAVVELPLTGEAEHHEDGGYR